MTRKVMMKLPQRLTLSIGRNVLLFKKQSPHIFFAVGVIGSITSTVLACRATLKLSPVLDEIQKDVNNVKALQGTVENSETAVIKNLYTDQQYRKDIVYVYVKGGLQIAKLYAPAAIVGIASMTCLTGSHVQMTKRNTALMAAYAAVQKAYDDYRDRIRERLGDERELEIYHAAAKGVVDKEEITTVDPNKWSPYAVFFDEYSKYWEKDPEMNRLYVQCQQNYANDLLRARGHIFLNEVYDMLGVDRTKAGAVVGWIIGESGDNFVDFGIFEAYNSRFVNGWERSIILDFNVDGVIYDKI